MKRHVILCYLTFIFFCINVNKSYAQVDSKLSGFLPSYSTISPSSLYNGIPDINIPLYTLNARGVSVPVSLSYDPSGITIHQEASSVGLGWVLNAGGHIIAETRDWNDHVGISRIENDSDAGILARYYPNSTSIKTSYNLGDDVEWRHEYDHLPDMYYYSCNGMSGKFILSDDLTTGISLPESTNKIEYNMSDIIITDDSGVRYIFKQKGIVGQIPANIETVVFTLNTIYTPQLDTIDFTYQSTRYYKPLYRTHKNLENEYYQAIDMKEMPLYLLKTISIRGGESIEFEFGNRRLDIYSAEAPDSVPTIEKVKILDNEGNIRKYFDLDYSYFTSEPYTQYLPIPKEISGHYLDGEYRIKQTDGSYITYTDIYVDPNYDFDIENDVYGYVNGQRQQIPGFFRRGGYIFTRHNDTVYAVLNEEYLTHTLPSFEEMYTFNCIPGIALTCDEQEEEYYQYKDSYEREQKAYYNQTPEAYHIPTKTIGDLYYFAIDEDYVDDLCSYYSSPCYYDDFRPYYHSNKSVRRLRLDGIKEYSGTTSESMPATTFEYSTTNLPHTYSSDFDHWGYYNLRDGMPNLSTVNTNYNDVFDVYNNPQPDIYPYDGYRNPNEDKMKANILEKINFPDGGYIKYNYEANRARTDATGTTEKIVGGLRLGSTETGTNDGQKYYTNYDYKVYEEQVSNGIHTLSPTNLFSGYIHASELQYEKGIGWVWGSSGYPPVYGRIMQTTEVMNSVLPLVKTRNGYVGYSDIAVTQEDSLENNLGTVLYKFYANAPLEFIEFTSGCTEERPFMKYARPTMPSDPMLGLQIESIVADKLGKIVSKTENEYELTEPNYKYSSNSSENIQYYKNYTHCYVTSVGGILPYITYLSSVVGILDIYKVTSKVPMLSAKHNYSYFPDQAKSMSESSYFLYDVHNSSFEISSLGMYDQNLIPFNVTGTYNSSLDAFNYVDGEYSGYIFKSCNTQKLLEKVNIRNSGEVVRERYWYPSHLASSGNIYEEMVNRNILSPIVKAEKFIDGQRMEGVRTDYAAFSKDGSASEDFLLPTESYSYYGDSYEKVNDYLSYDGTGNLKEVINANGIKSTTKWGYNATRPIAQMTNIETDKVYTDVFGDGLSNWTKVDNSGDNDTQFSIEDGKLKLFNLASAASGECDRIYYNLGSEITGNVVLEFDVTIDNSNSWDLTIGMGGSSWTTANGGTECAVWSAINNETWRVYSGSWTDIKSGLTVGKTYRFKIVAHPSLNKADYYVNGELCLSDFNFRYSSSGIQKIAFGNYGYSTVNCTWYIDDVRFYPEESKVKTFNYDLLFGVTSITDERGIPTYYEYDGLGRLTKVLNQNRHVLKQYDYHFND